MKEHLVCYLVTGVMSIDGQIWIIGYIMKIYILLKDLI